MAGAAHYIESLYPNSWKELSKKEWADVMLDFSKFVSHHIIINKHGEAVQMKMNEAQEKVAELILRYVFPPKGQNPRPIKLVIHKSRQMGISTILTLIEKYIASRKTKINLLHILPDEKLAKNYWIEKGEPLWQGSDPQILPDAKATNTPTPYIQVKEYADTDMQVNIRYTGSNSKSAMRSSTNHIVILDEYAFFENVRRLEKGVLASQPKTGMAITAYCSCVTKDTLILPDTGMEEIGEHTDGYSPADKNLYGLGGNHHADQYYGTGLVPTKKIKTKAGFEIECTPNHRLWTVDGWKRADEFKPGDRIDIQLGQQQFGDYVCDDFVKRPYKKGFKAKDIDLTLDEDLAYLCGLVVAEGDWSDTYVDITIGDKEVHDWLVKRWGASKQRKDSKFHYRISSVHLVDFINWLGIRKLAKNKNIPAKVMKWPKKFQAAFISGMFDGDGCANRGRQRISYTTVSDALAKQLQVVLLNYGIFSRRRLVHKKANSIGDRNLPPSDVWVVEITHSMARLFAKEIGFRLERKRRIAESYSCDGERAGGYDRHFNRADLGTLPTKYGYISRCKTIKSDTYDLLPNKPYYDGMAADYIESVEDSSANCYDFCVPETHSYFSNGFVSHNTADGMNHFYDVVKQSQEPNSGIEHLFLPWHMLKEYELPVSKDSRLYDLNKYEPTDYDMKLFAIFEKAGYPEDSWLRKIAWYDDVLSTEAKGDTDYMNSEYPTTAEESFSASGRPVLPLKVINFWMKQDHPYTAIAPVAKTDKRSLQLKVQFEPDPNSPIRRYIEPRPGHKYMVAVDCAEGYAGDMSAGVIIDIKDMEEVCSFVVDYEQNDLAEVVVDLAKYYNNARIVPEKNMAGLFVESVQLLGYWNLYVDPDYKGPQTNKMFGIRTTVASKNEAINRLKFLMNNGIYKAHDKVFMEQAIHYSWKQLPSGGSKAEAVGQDDDGNPWHDDAIACRLTLVLALDFRQYKDYLGKDRNG